MMGLMILQSCISINHAVMHTAETKQCKNDKNRMISNQGCLYNMSHTFNLCRAFCVSACLDLNSSPRSARSDRIASWRSAAACFSTLNLFVRMWRICVEISNKPSGTAIQFIQCLLPSRYHTLLLWLPSLSVRVLWQLGPSAARPPLFWQLGLFLLPLSPP